MTKRIDREGPIHRSIVQWLAKVLPDAIVHHSRGEINKSGWRIAKELGEAKAKGAVKGFPDLIVLPWAHIGPVFFEVKAEGNYADKDQKALHERMRALGYKVAVVRSIDDCRQYLAEWCIATREAGSWVKMPVIGTINGGEK